MTDQERLSRLGGPIKQPDSLSQKAYQRLREAMASDVLSPGMPVSETAFTRELGISRSSLREALIRLETEGYLVRGAGGRWSVERLDEAAAIDMYECRGALEGLAAALAAERATPEELDVLSKHLDRARETFNAGDMLLTARWTTQFHDGVVKYAHNEKLNRLMDQLHAQLEELRGLMLVHRTRDDSFMEDNELLLEAIRDGDSVKAEQYARTSAGKDRDAVILLFKEGLL